MSLSRRRGRARKLVGRLHAVHGDAGRRIAQQFFQAPHRCRVARF